MTITDVIEMARKAGGYDGFTSPPTDWNEGDFVISPEALLKFAALVRNEALEALKAENEALQAEVARLRADRDSWAQQASDRVADWHAEHLRAERLAEALREWWKAHRPVGWTEDQHRSCPHVNLVTGAEKALADAMLRAREASND